MYDGPPHAPGVLVVNRADALPLVSVVIPTRNRADFLDVALLSVMAQEGIGTEFEIVRAGERPVTLLQLAP